MESWIQPKIQARRVVQNQPEKDENTWKKWTQTQTLGHFTVISDVWWDTGMRNLAREERRRPIQTTEGRERAGGEEENISGLKFDTVSISGTETCALDHSKCVMCLRCCKGQSNTSFMSQNLEEKKPDPNDLWSHYQCIKFNEISSCTHTMTQRQR